MRSLELRRWAGQAYGSQLSQRPEFAILFALPCIPKKGSASEMAMATTLRCKPRLGNSAAEGSAAEWQTGPLESGVGPLNSQKQGAYYHFWEKHSYCLF